MNKNNLTKSALFTMQVKIVSKWIDLRSYKTENMALNAKKQFLQNTSESNANVRIINESNPTSS